MKKRILCGIAIIAAVAITTSVSMIYKGLSAATEDAKLTLYGNIDIRTVDLAFNNSERIATVLVDEGDTVHKGQLLAALNKVRFEWSVAQAQAQVDAQKQVVARLEAGSRPGEIRRARAEVQASQADVNDAETHYERMQALVESKAETLQNRDDALARLSKARAKLEAAGATLQLLLEGPREEEIAAARATLEAYKAKLALARVHLADVNLVAPSDGVIRNRLLEVGDMASPQRPAFTLALTSPVWVRAYIDEPDLGKIHPGMPATITTDSFPGKEYAGWIGSISPTAEFTPKSVQTPELRTQLVYEVRVFARDPDNELRLGMPTTVTIDLEVHADSATGLDMATK